MNSKSWLVTMVDERGVDQCGSFKNIEIDGRLNESTAHALAMNYVRMERMAGYKMRKGGSWSDVEKEKIIYTKEAKRWHDFMQRSKEIKD